jgi:hypothetical protein
MTPPEDRDLAALRDFLAERDIACPACRYNLRGLTSPNCPECNQPLELRVSIVEPASGAFIATVVGLAVGAGAALLLIVTVAFVSVMEGPPPDGVFVALFFIYPACVVLVLGTSMARMVSRKGRRRFAFASRAQRRSQAIAAWVISMAAFFLWLILVYANAR